MDYGLHKHLYPWIAPVHIYQILLSTPQQLDYKHLTIKSVIWLVNHTIIFSYYISQTFCILCHSALNKWLIIYVIIIVRFWHDKHPENRNHISEHSVFPSVYIWVRQWGTWKSHPYNSNAKITMFIMPILVFDTQILWPKIMHVWNWLVISMVSTD